MKNVVLGFVLLVFSSLVSAGANFRSASVSPSSVVAGGNFTLTVSMDGNGSHWDSTTVIINGQQICFNEENVTTKTRNYSLTAPSTANNYTITVSVNDRNSSCNGGSSSGSTSLTVTQGATPSNHACAAVWPNDLNSALSVDFTYLQSPSTSSNDLTLSTGASQQLAPGTYVYDNLVLNGATLTFSGSDPVTIYANKLTIVSSHLNQEASNADKNPLILIANKAEISTSQIEAALYIKQSNVGASSILPGHTVQHDIVGSTVWGSVTSPDSIATSGNTIHYNSFYFDHQNIGAECSTPVASCPAVNDDFANIPALGGSVKINDGVIINEVSQQNNWIELYIPPNTYADFTNAKLTLNSNANGNGTGVYTLCTSNCTYTTDGSSGAYVLFGNIADLHADVEYSMSSLKIHPTWQEIILTDQDGELIHYLRYGNTSNTPNGWPQYTDCASSVSTVILNNGSDKHVCANTDGVIPAADWSNSCGQTPGSSNNEIIATYLDLFASKDYSNNDGTSNWSNSWVESESGNNPTTGNFQINHGQLQLSGASLSIERKFDLTNYTNAELEFEYYFQTSATDDDVFIELSKDNGSSWTQVFFFDGVTNGSGVAAKSIDISNNYAGEEVIIRLRTHSGFNNNDDFDLNYIAIKASGSRNSVDHYRIVHPTNGLTCSAYSVELRACANADCSSVYTDAVTAAVTKTFASNVETILTTNTSTGIASANQLTHLQPGLVTFGLNNSNPAANVKCYAGSYNGTEIPSCQMTFADSGFVLSSISDFVAAANWQQVEVQALKTDPNGSGSCVPVFSGDTQVNLLFQYDTPSNPVDSSVQLQFTEPNASGDASDTTAQPAKALTHNSVTTKTLNFSNATARFFINYFDVGRLQLTVSDARANSAVISDSKTFVSYPAELALGLADSGGLILGSAGNLTHVSKEPFSLAIQAVNANNQVTKNYIPGQLELAAQMTAPLFSDLANQVDFTYANASKITITDNNSSWSNVQTQVASNFNSTGYLFQAASFNDVGTFTLNVRDSNYFGKTIKNLNGNSQDSPVGTGRFVPYYFSLSERTKGQLESTGSGYSYIGEELSYGTNPVIEFTAKNYDGSVASNYGGEGKTGGTFQFSSGFADRSYAEKGNNTGFDDTHSGLSSGTVSYSESDNYDGQFIATLTDDKFIYDKPDSVIAPFNSQIELTLSIKDLLDTDGVGYCEEDILGKIVNASCPATFEQYSMAMTVGPELLYGRLFLENIIGAETTSLFVPALLQYWDGNTWILNDGDSTTEFSSLTGSVTYSNGNASPFTLTIDTKDNANVTRDDFSNGTIPLGAGLVVNPNQGERANLRLILNNVPDHLVIDWDLDGDIDDDDDVFAEVIFGSFSGNKRIIYKRER